MKYYNTSGGFEERVVVTDDSTFFNNPNPVFDEESVADDALDRRFDRPQFGDPENRPPIATPPPSKPKPQEEDTIEVKPTINEPVVTPTPTAFDPSTFDYSTIDWGGYFDNASIGAGQSLTPSVAEEVSNSEFIMGCTDEKAVNYDPNANVNDGLCTYQDSGDNNTETKTDNNKKDNNTLKMAVAGLAVLAIFVAIKK